MRINEIYIFEMSNAVLPITLLWDLLRIQIFTTPTEANQIPGNIIDKIIIGCIEPQPRY